MEQIEDHLKDWGGLVSIATNDNGVPVLSAKFIHTHFIVGAFRSLIGDPMMKGYSSKAIGKTLLVWKR